MRKGLACVVLALCCPLAVTAATAPAPRGTIAYTLAADIWTVSADGTGRRRVTRDGFGTQPSWSRDGKRILSSRRADAALAVIRPDGGVVRTVPLPRGLAGAREPDWSRDGRIAFVGLEPSSPCCRPAGIWVGNGDGSGLREVVHHGFSPDWSPDGKKIAYTQPIGFHGERAVDVVAGDGGPPTRVAPGHSPAWSPDGRRLAFVDATGAVAVVNADGSEARTIDPCGRAPAWSPNGRWLAYLSCRSDFRTQLYIVPSAGGSPTGLTRYAGPYGAPDWRPAG